ncbi:MAG TPA: hypothetical protein VFW40_08635 [Capsulimonadaceae bacterium]|nr:hypothetical protein [Capsulimonadaceae bacterium]
MKHAVSVSLGSTAGDFARDIELAGRRVHLSREGTNGDIERARAQICELDGKIDAIGLGGIDIYLYVGEEQLVIGDGLRLAQAAAKTPVVDGSGLKNTLERDVVRELALQRHINPATRVLMVSALDRFGMAEELVRMGCPCVFGDLIFNIGLDFPLTKLSEIEDLAKKYKSRLMNVPFHMLYPTGSTQDQKKADPRYAKYYEQADVIAGDAHLILRHLPERLPGKGIITNTTRPHTVARFAEAGIEWLATTTPELEGVSGGTNLMEAALVALMEKPATEITPADYEAWTKRLGWRGSFLKLGGK